MCKHCSHLAGDHAEEDSLIGNFVKGQCLRYGCRCRNYEPNEIQAQLWYLTRYFRRCVTGVEDAKTEE